MVFCAPSLRERIGNVLGMKPTGVVITPLSTYERHGWYSAELVWFLIASSQNRNYNVTFHPVHKVDPVMAARNLAGKWFLAKSNAEWLCMIDNDMAPQMNLLTLLDDAYQVHDIIAPQMHLWNEVHHFPALCWETKEHLGGKLTPEQTKELLSKKMVELNGCGTGAIFIRRRVLEQMPYPWFKRTFDEDGRMTASEDMLFMHDAVAKGFRIWGHTQHVVGHYRSVDLSTIPVPRKDITPESFLDTVEENEHVHASS